MRIIEKSYFSKLKVKEVYFSDEPFDVADCDGVSFFACKNKVNAPGFTATRAPTAIVDLTRELDLIFDTFDRKSTRYAIRRAEREGPDIRMNKDFKEFYDAYQSLMRRKGLAPAFGISSVSLKLITRYGTLFTARLNGNVVGGHLYLEDEAHLRLWLSASKRLEVPKEESVRIGNVNRLLHWEAMKYAKQKGIEEFDWGGLWDESYARTSHDRHSINSFKLSYGSVPTMKYSYAKVYSPIYGFAKRLYSQTNRMARGLRR